jgi:hypothetical protein
MHKNLEQKINASFQKGPMAIDLFNILSFYTGTLPDIVYRSKGGGVTSSSNLATRIFIVSSTSSSMASSSSLGMLT